MKNLKQYTDQFDKLIADSTQNKAGLNSAQQFFPDRWRVEKNGSRQFIRYGETADFTDNVDYYDLSPTGTDVMRMRTTEIFRYVPQYTIKPSFAFKVNQSLQAGDKVTVAYGRADLNNSMAAADGWILEFVPSLADNEAYFSAYRNGTVVSMGGSKEVVSFQKPITNHRRFALETNWYNVGNAILTETFTDGGAQENVPQGYISSDDVRGPESGNHPIELSIKSGGNGTQLQVGSAAFILLGDANPKLTFREITPDFTVSTTGSYTPIYALRSIDRETKMTFRGLNIVNYTGSGLTRVSVRTFDQSKVSFAGTDSWSPPQELNEYETVMQARTDPDGYAGADGVIGNAGLGGDQKLRQIYSSTSQGNQAPTIATSQGGDLINEIHNDEVALVLVDAENTGDLIFELDYEEQR